MPDTTTRRPGQQSDRLAEATEGSTLCRICGDRLDFDTDGRGRLVALDYGTLTVHRHPRG